MSEAGIDVSAYQSGAGEGSTGFAQLLRAEWKKFRTIRGWLVGMITAALVTVAIAALDHASCGGMVTPGGAVSNRSAQALLAQPRLASSPGPKPGS